MNSRGLRFPGRFRTSREGLRSSGGETGGSWAVCSGESEVTSIRVSASCIYSCVYVVLSSPVSHPCCPAVCLLACLSASLSAIGSCIDRSTYLSHFCFPPPHAPCVHPPRLASSLRPITCRVFAALVLGGKGELIMRRSHNASIGPPACAHLILPLCPMHPLGACVVYTPAPRCLLPWYRVARASW